MKDKIRKNNAGHFWTSDVVGKTQEASIFSLEVNYLIRIDQGWLTSVSVLPQNKSRQIAACCSRLWGFNLGDNLRKWFTNSSNIVPTSISSCRINIYIIMCVWLSLTTKMSVPMAFLLPSGDKLTPWSDIQAKKHKLSHNKIHRKVLWLSNLK